jgi:hypothetical protein
MKKISLPATKTVSFRINMGEDANVEDDSDGAIGSEQFEALEIARANGGKVLWSTMCLEKSLESIITNYFMGPLNGASARRQLFESELLQTSFFQFSVKKHLIDKISKEYSVPKPKDRNQLQSYLKSIMLWRNSFAHGSLVLDGEKGVLLRYYSGTPKEEVLNERYWNTVESVFELCRKLVDELLDESRKYNE